MTIHTIEANDCISTLARRYGFHWRDLWEHPDNESLRERRGDPNLLLPGDTLTVPDPVARRQSLPTRRQHKLVVRNRLVVLRLRLQDNGEALAGSYRLEVAGRTLEGELDGDGQLEQMVPAAATRAVLILTDRGERIDLWLGDLDPPDSPSGAIERLVNLGLIADQGVRELSPEIEQVLRLIQREEGLSVTGELDADTGEALRRWHGC